METKHKALALLMTSTITLGAFAIVLLSNHSKDSIISARGNPEVQSRTVTAGKSERIIGLHRISPSSGKVSANEFVAFNLSNSESQGIVFTTQQQHNLSPDNDCLFALWTNSDLSFEINPTLYANNEFYTDSSYEHKLNVQYFNHLTSMDIILDNSDDHRMQTMTCTGGGTLSARETVDATTYKYTFYPSGGFLTNNENAVFSSDEKTDPDKALWVRALVFHYDC